MRHACDGSLKTLLEIREVAERRGGLEPFLVLQPSASRKELQFMLLCQLLDTEQVERMAATLPPDARLIYRITLLADTTERPFEVNDDPPFYGIEDYELPF